MLYRRLFRTKKYFCVAVVFILLISHLSFLISRDIVFAQGAQNDPRQAAQDLAQGSPIQSPNDIFRILKKVVQWTYTVFFIVAVIYIIFAAFTYLTAGDQAEKIKSAHKQLMYAAIAIAIALISGGAAKIIEAFLA